MVNKTILLNDGVNQSDNEYALFPLKYEWAWSSYQIMKKNFWIPEEVGAGNDLAEWKGGALDEKEQHMFLTVFAQVTTFDLLRTADLTQQLIPMLQAPELIHCLTTQGFQECLHTESYQYTIETLGLDPDDIYQRYRTVPQLAARVSLTEKIGSVFSSDIEGILRGLIHTYIAFEGVWFTMNLLGPIQSLYRRNLFRGVAEQFQYIVRDEQTHVALGLNLIRDFIREYPKAWTPDLQRQVVDDMHEALKLEDDFIDYALPSPILGYNAKDHKLMSRYYAERWMGRVPGMENISFGGKNTLPWIDEMVATLKEKNFFETRVTEYQKGISFEDEDEKTPNQLEFELGWDNPLSKFSNSFTR